MLQRRQRFEQPPAPLVNEKRRANPGLDIAEPLQDFRPAVNPVSIRAAQRYAQPRILRGNRCPV